LLASITESLCASVDVDADADAAAVSFVTRFASTLDVPGCTSAVLLRVHQRGRTGTKAGVTDVVMVVVDDMVV
jgi:hypothetical protein